MYNIRSIAYNVVNNPLLAPTATREFMARDCIENGRGVSTREALIIVIAN